MAVGPMSSLALAGLKHKKPGLGMKQPSEGDCGQESACVLAVLVCAGGVCAGGDTAGVPGGWTGHQSLACGIVMVQSS